jgi:hypothetical protein
MRRKCQGSGRRVGPRPWLEGVPFAFPLGTTPTPGAFSTVNDVNISLLTLSACSNCLARSLLLMWAL